MRVTVYQWILNDKIQVAFNRYYAKEYDFSQLLTVFLCIHVSLVNAHIPSSYK